MILKEIHEKRSEFFIDRTSKDDKSATRRRSLSQRVS